MSDFVIDVGIVSVLFYNKSIRCDQDIKNAELAADPEEPVTEPKLTFNLHAFTELFVCDQLP